MSRVIVTGALGRMGRITCRKLQEAKDLSLAAGVDILAQEGTLGSLEAFSGEADILIDFSHHTAAPGIMAWAKEHGVAVIMCTTGHTEQEQEAIRAAADTIPVFYSANMSLGVALLAELAKKTAAVFPDADIEIVETHHNRKADAPSGTALMIAEGIREARGNVPYKLGRAGHDKRNAGEIGIHAVRAGNIVGIHEVLVCTDTQSITLKHEAYSRALFAEGAVAAADYICTVSEPGIYNMYDMLK